MACTRLNITGTAGIWCHCAGCRPRHCLTWNTLISPMSFHSVSQPGEIFTLCDMPHKLRADEEVVKTLRAGELQLDDIPGCPEELMSLIYHCCNGHPTERPSFSDVVITLSDISADSDVLTGNMPPQSNLNENKKNLWRNIKIRWSCASTGKHWKRFFQMSYDK